MIRKKFKKPKILFMALIVAGCMAMLCATAEAVDYYVALSGDDNANDGMTEDTPWRTIGKANTEWKYFI